MTHTTWQNWQADITTHLPYQNWQAPRQDKLFELYYGELGNIFRTKYRKHDLPFTSQVTHHLKSQGIFAMVNGHRHHLNGQQIKVRNGLLNF